MLLYYILRYGVPIILAFVIFNLYLYIAMNAFERGNLYDKSMEFLGWPSLSMFILIVVFTLYCCYIMPLARKPVSVIDKSYSERFKYKYYGTVNNRADEIYVVTDNETHTEYILVITDKGSSLLPLK